MYLDILGPESYGLYNRKLAKLTNILTAVYWQELLEIVSKVVKKKKFDENGFFKLDRKYLEEQTSINVELQLEIEDILTRLNVLSRSEADSELISVNLEVMAKLLISDDTKKLDKVEKIMAKVSKTQKASTKKAGVIYTMKQLLSEKDQDIRQLYEAWIESAYASGRFLTKQKIQLVEQALAVFSKDDQVKLLNIGIQTGWTDASWWIQKLGLKVDTKPQKTSTEFNQEMLF